MPVPCTSENFLGLYCFLAWTVFCNSSVLASPLEGNGYIAQICMLPRQYFKASFDMRTGFFFFFSVICFPLLGNHSFPLSE